MKLIPESLTSRLSLLTAVMIALVSVALLTVLHEATSNRFVEAREEVLATNAEDALKPLAALIEEHYSRGDWPAVLSMLADERRLPASFPRNYLLLDNDMNMVANGDLARSLRISASPVDGGIRLEINSGGMNNQLMLEMVVTDPELLEDESGTLFGYLLLLPGLSDKDIGDEFAMDVWKASAFWILGIFLVALACTITLMRYSLKPVRTLVKSAKNIQEGKPPEPAPRNAGVEFKELVEAFDRAGKAIEKTESLRKRLITDIAHELRTPVTNIKAQLEALDSNLIQWDEAAASVIRAESRTLERLIADFQQITDSDAGNLRLYPHRMPARDCLDSILRPLVGSSSGELSLECDEDLTILADEDRLRQVFGNLVENSARHAQQPLRITVSVRRDGSATVIRFSDNGPGIPAEDMPHVFERFYRADPSRTRATGGSGLGLTIVNGIVKAMNGSIRIVPSDASDVGAVFDIRLPAF